jgi:hypothetical protein
MIKLARDGRIPIKHVAAIVCVDACQSGLANRGIALNSSNYFEADFDALPADIRRRRRSACERVADKASAAEKPGPACWC